VAAADLRRGAVVEFAGEDPVRAEAALEMDGAKVGGAGFFRVFEFEREPDVERAVFDGGVAVARRFPERTLGALGAEGRTVTEDEGADFVAGEVDVEADGEFEAPFGAVLDGDQAGAVDALLRRRRVGRGRDEQEERGDEQW
jgi:hypothetical protein